MHDRRKRKRIFHVNMLRKFHVPKVSEANYFIEEIDDDIREEEIPVWNENPEGQPLVGSQLDINQKKQLDDVIRQFADVLQHTTQCYHLQVYWLPMTLAIHLVGPVHSAHATVRMARTLLTLGVLCGRQTKCKGSTYPNLLLLL